MTTAESIFLGILQGTTEFLPISSSGHLILAEHFLGIEEATLAFDVMLHLGTLVAVLAYFSSDWLSILQGFLPGAGQNRPSRRLLALLVIGTVPGATLGFLLESQVETILRAPWLIAGTLSGVALLLLLAEHLADHRRSFESVGWRDALCIGAAQALAIIPGVSRSGITMTAALFLGLDRIGAARFSFLLSAPIIAGAGLHQNLEFLRCGTTGLGANCLWGFGAAALSGYGVIAFLMRFLTRHSFRPFAYYRLALAAAVAMALKFGGQ